MLIKLGQQQWINTRYIESICIAVKNEVRVYMINNEFYYCAVYDTYEEAVNAVDELAEIINKERKW